ncbi:elongation factor G [Rhodocaloribacter litoris]|uniref:elongation factor G n=1 Tax=Rhodocaloribacter litoris TaxID=2558931 RepID=UPI00141F2314|nr:elongation factor G [Rhodocaloribacter litoris]QXD14361.1 elongation factor G [Rhodocaloribacter litoris]GIV60618.1 MAG: elongation factor G [Rhodothermaceae bacterium]
MNVYDADHIRNIALVGHQGSGKTMLAEAMLHASGALQRMGSIEEGNTVSDYHPSERERQMSVFTSLLHVEWKGHKINILDTPGYPDFVGEVIAALKVADTALYVINAAEGVQVGTELAWQAGEQMQKPAMFVFNHMDKPGVDFRDVVRQVRERFGRGATVVQLPAGTGTRSIIDVLLMKQLTFDEHGNPALGDIDPAFQQEAEELHNELVENIAENDEALMELYFEKGELSEDEMRQGLHEAMLRRELFPIFLTSATNQIGVTRLMSFIDNVCPSPAEMPPAETTSGEPVQADPAAEPVAFIYRTMAEQHVGDYSFFRVYAGTLEQGMDLENAQSGNMERLGQLYAINGRERDPVAKMVAGDLGALVKLRATHTNDTLRRKGSRVVIKPIAFPEPRYSVAVRPVREGEEDKLAQGLHQLVEEDPSLVVTHDPLLGQIVIGGQGEMQLEIARYRLKSRFGVDVEFARPKVAYRETVQTKARAKYRHKKQTGGAGQFADIALLVEPLNGEFQPDADITVRGKAEMEMPWGARIEFIDAIVGGVIDMRRFFGAIQKGVAEAMQNGPIAGYPVGDVRVVIYDGGMHSVDSNEAAFKTAARMCFREAFRQANPVLLEPIYNVEILVPEAYTGDVMGDLNTRRARIQGIEAEGPFQKIIAQVPEAELYRYSTALRSLTQGRGLHRATFSHYEPMPRHVQDKVVAEAAALEEA